VVPAEASRWKYPPFSGLEVKDRIYGRGAADMKATAVAQAMILVKAKSEKWVLDRDLIFLGTADEEEESKGARWMLEQHPSLLKNAEFVLTEGNMISVAEGKTTAWNVATTEKSQVIVKLVAGGVSGHPTDLNPDQAIPRLLEALAKVSSLEFPVRVIPSVRNYFKQLSTTSSGEEKIAFRDVDSALKDSLLKEKILSNHSFLPMLKATYAVTRLQAGNKSNVVPGEATAILDFRFLPGENVKKFLDDLKTSLRDPKVRLIFSEPPEPGESSQDTDLFSAIVKARDRFEPGVPLLTPPLTSTTDAPFFRAQGMVVYGFEPFHIGEEDDHSHGDDEFLSRANLISGSKILEFIVRQTAGSLSNR